MSPRLEILQYDVGRSCSHVAHAQLHSILEHDRCEKGTYPRLQFILTYKRLEVNVDVNLRRVTRNGP